MKPGDRILPPRFELQLFWLRTKLDHQLVDAGAFSLVVLGIVVVAPFCGDFGLYLGGVCLVVVGSLCGRAWWRVTRTAIQIRQLEDLR